MAPTVSELRNEVKAMEDSWQKMYDDEGGGNGKAMLLLALRIRQCCQKLKVYFATHLQPEQLSKHMKVVDHKVFESHAACARDCLDAGAYRDTLKHVNKALELTQQHRCWEESVVMNILYYKKEAWKGLGEHANYIDVAVRRARNMAQYFPNVRCHERVDALLEIATVQIEQNDYQAAIKTAREALSVEGVPQAARNISRVKLGVALLGMSDGDEALRELERCEREWSMSGEGTFWSTDALKRDKAVLDECLQRLRKVQAADPLKNVPGGKETMHMLIAGCLDDAAAHADDTFMVALKETTKSGSKTEATWLPELAARMFTIINCFLLDDRQAAERLAAVKMAVKLCKREPLDDACPICLQKIDWPRPLKEGTRVTVHGLKNTPQHNGSQGVVERVSVGSEGRVQVRFRRNAAPEEGVLTIEERKAVLRGLQQVDEPKHPEKVRRAAEASLSAPEGSLDLMAVAQVISDVVKRGSRSALTCSTKEDVIASLEEATAEELARLEASSAYSLRIRSANLKVSEGYVDASRRALITGCMHVYHARCIKRAVDEGQRTCPVCGDSSHFAETLVECGAMPSWDRPSWDS